MRVVGVKNLLLIMLLIWKFSSHTLPLQSSLWAIMMLHEHDVECNVPQGRVSMVQCHFH